MREMAPHLPETRHLWDKNVGEIWESMKKHVRQHCGKIT